MTIDSGGAAASSSLLPAPSSATRTDSAKPSGKSHFHRPHGDGEVSTPAIANAAQGSTAPSSASTRVNVLA